MIFGVSRGIASAEMDNKIIVASESRASDEFLIIARTDALSDHGIDEALHRAESYLKAGADVLFIEAPESEEQMQQICDEFSGVPLVANMVAGGTTPIKDDATLFEMGYQIVIHPVYLLGAAYRGMQNALQGLRSSGRADHAVADITDLNQLLDFQHVWDLDERFGHESGS